MSLVQQFLKESDASRAAKAVNLNASLEKDLGIGSLERMELFHRFEKEFTIHFSSNVVATIQTIMDLIIAIELANPPKQSRLKEFAPMLDKQQIDPSKTVTLTELLSEYATLNPKHPHIYLQDGEGFEQTITYGQLFQAAKRISNGLIKLGIKPLETVALMLLTSEDFFFTFFGILYAGAIPVPIYPPFRPDQIEEYIKREAKILNNAQARVLVTFPKAKGFLSHSLSSFIPSLMTVSTIDDLIKSSAELPDIAIERDQAALIQYTSGSTGDPKGVLLTHDNLLSNIKAYGQALAINPTDVVVSWLPLYHDMGLIGSWLGSLYHGIPLTILSPITFLIRPERWLWAIHYHRATISASPNFGYELCVNKIEPKLLEGLDLSCWRIAANGAETIYPKTIEKFYNRFAQYGFKTQTILPVYGLAESSVGLAISSLNREPRIDRVERKIFDVEQRAVASKKEGKNYHEFVSCGVTLPNHKVRIVSDTGAPLTDRHVGQLQFKGPSTMQGYYRNIKATQAICHDGWWDSGDYAYIAEEEIFIVGRKKDIIIKAGRNLYPQEAEEITTQIPGIRKGCVAAFGINHVKHGTEKFIIVAETKEKNRKEKDRILALVTEKISIELGIPPDHVVLVPPKTIPKTSSGKLRRSSCKKFYLNGTLVKYRIPVWMQVNKLFFITCCKHIINAGIKALKIVYAFYISLLLILTMPFFLFSIIISSKKYGKSIAKFYARNIFRFAFCPIKVEGTQYLKSSKPLVLIANHTSYLDAIILYSILPDNVLFVAKKELLKAPLLKTLLNKLGHIKVDRLDFSKSGEETRLMSEKLQQGFSIFIFPEGTFTYATGLRPFKLGAFKIAAETNTAICPIGIQGARYILRSGSYLPTINPIKVSIGEPTMPQGSQWQDIIQLRTAMRVEIAKHCGELTLDLIAAGLTSDTH
ncbi:MAG: AMP-binding protein [Gammaproteobacteria bacterium]|nr:AMP-binding protein [Gammaproteobacteria bacterium]